MNGQRIREIQEETAYPESQSVQSALMQVWNEVAQTKRTELIRTMHERAESLEGEAVSKREIGDLDTMHQKMEIAKSLRTAANFLGGVSR